MECVLQDADGFPIDIQITESGDGSFSCVYVPIKAIKHTLIVTWAEVNVPDSPFRVGQRLTSSSLPQPCELPSGLLSSTSFQNKGNLFRIKAPHKRLPLSEHYR